MMICKSESLRGRYYLPEKIITQGAIINRPRGFAVEDVFLIRADDIRPYAEWCVLCGRMISAPT